ncbi:hypothetical protein SLE2022_301750 [Rubroshorea leprosula]
MHMAFPGSMAHVTESFTAVLHAPSSSSHCHLMHSFHAAANQMEGVSNVGCGHASSSQAGQKMENLIVNGLESQGNYHPMHSFHAAVIKWEVFPTSDMVMPALLRQGKEL